jgi:hypothetical protein
MPETPEDIEYGRTTAWERIAREEDTGEGMPRRSRARSGRGLTGQLTRLVRPLVDRIRRSS